MVPHQNILRAHFILYREGSFFLIGSPRFYLKFPERNSSWGGEILGYSYLMKPLGASSSTVSACRRMNNTSSSTYLPFLLLVMALSMKTLLKGSAQKFKLLKHAAFMGFKLQLKIFIQKCTVC